jgi:hypothetical protein
MVRVTKRRASISDNDVGQWKLINSNLFSCEINFNHFVYCLFCFIKGNVNGKIYRGTVCRFA